MKKITTTNDLKIAVEAIVAAYELNDSIDEGYQLEWSVIENDFTFRVNYSWINSEIIDTEHDPRMSKPNLLTVEDNYFIINKTESYRKLAKEVFDAIGNVTATPFEVSSFSESI